MFQFLKKKESLPTKKNTCPEKVDFLSQYFHPSWVWCTLILGWRKFPMLTSNKSLWSHMLIILPKKKSGGLWITNTVNTAFFGEPRCSEKMSKTPQNGVKLDNHQNLVLSNRQKKAFLAICFFVYLGVAWPRSEANGLKEFIDFWQISRQDQSSGPWKSMLGRCESMIILGSQAKGR